MLLDLVIPGVIIIFVCSFSVLVSKIKFFNIFAYLGKNSITIMYLHLPINMLIKRWFEIDYGLFIFTFLGVCISLIAGVLMRKSNILSVLYLGNSIKSRPISKSLTS